MMDLNQHARTRSRDWGEIRKDERIWEQAGPLRSAWLRVRQTNGNKKRERERKAGGGWLGVEVVLRRVPL